MRPAERFSAREQRPAAKSVTLDLEFDDYFIAQVKASATVLAVVIVTFAVWAVLYCE